MHYRFVHLWLWVAMFLCARLCLRLWMIEATCTLHITGGQDDLRSVELLKFRKSSIILNNDRTYTLKTMQKCKRDVWNTWKYMEIFKNVWKTMILMNLYLFVMLWPVFWMSGPDFCICDCGLPCFSVHGCVSRLWMIEATCTPHITGGQHDLRWP